MTCRLRAPDTTNAHGDAIADWANATKCDVSGGVFAPVKASEANELGREGVTIGWVLIFRDKHPDIVALDRIEHDGNTYLVDGEPARYTHYRTGRQVMEVALSRVTG